MRLGRCVLRDYGYVGCFADVVAHMDVICSGRRTCSIRIPDASEMPFGMRTRAAQGTMC